nr:MAG TPA: hypothetical protein [Caudoviricetes sp.]
MRNINPFCTHNRNILLYEIIIYMFTQKFA